jgi:hypothetical protein
MTKLKEKNTSIPIAYNLPIDQDFGMSLNAHALKNSLLHLMSETQFWSPSLLKPQAKISKKRLNLFRDKSLEAFIYYDKCKMSELDTVRDQTGIDILALLNWTLVQSAWLTGRLTGDWRQAYYISERCKEEHVKNYTSILKPFRFILNAIVKFSTQQTNSIQAAAETLEIIYPEYTNVLHKVTKETLRRKKCHVIPLGWKPAIAYGILIGGIFGITYFIGMATTSDSELIHKTRDALAISEDAILTKWNSVKNNEESP